MLQGLQPISVRRAALRSRCVLPKLLQRLQACFLQGGAQFGALPYLGVAAAVPKREGTRVNASRSSLIST